MKTLVASTLALAIASPFAATAQDMTSSGIVTGEYRDGLLRAESLIGAQIYTMNHDELDYETEWGWTDNRYYDGLDDRWENIGEVDDIVLSRDGNLIGVIAEVGGFLDIGDSEVLMSLDDLRIVGGGVGFDYGTNNVSFVTNLSEEQIEGMEEVDTGWWD
jgi:hypothetical protein